MAAQHLPRRPSSGYEELNQKMKKPWCIQQQGAALLPGALVLTPASLILSSTTLANCDWMPASYTSRNLPIPSRTSNLLSFVTMEPHCLKACRAMESGHLLHSTLTCPPGVNARHLKRRHLFVSAAQFISSSEDNRSAALWVDQQWNTEWFGENYETPYFQIRHRHPPSWNGPTKNSVGSA